MGTIKPTPIVVAEAVMGEEAQHSAPERLGSTGKKTEKGTENDKTAGKQLKQQ